MRKLTSLGLCALLFGFFSASVVAGNVEECEFLKDKSHPDYAPGLYGLCVAWHNADDKAKDKLADKFFDRAGFEVPGSGPEEPEVTCPCWTAESLATATAGWSGSFCVTDESLAGADVAVFAGNYEVSAGYLLYPIDPEGGTECLLLAQGSFVGMATDLDQDAVCRADVQTLQNDPEFAFPPCF